MDKTLLVDLLTSIVNGGPVMYALAALSLVLYFVVIRLLLFVMSVNLGQIKSHARPHISRRRRNENNDENQAEWDAMLVKYEDTLWRFRQFVQSRLRFSNALLVAAPLLGLLGTVIGMLDTFRGLSLQSGYETATMVAAGVKRALITTETGLIIAIPALFFIYWIKRVTNKRELELLQVKILTFGKQ